MTEQNTPQPEPAPGDPETPGPAAGSVSTAQPPTCPTRTRLYQDGRVIQEGFPAEQISELLAATPDSVVWLDLYEPNQADLQIVVEEFGLHPLAVEDALHTEQRPKVDHYRSHLFVNVYAVSIPDGQQRLVSSEISAFVTSRALITVRKDEFDIDALVARWDLAGDLGATVATAPFLLYGLLDAIADGHYDAIQQLDDAVDELEDQLFTDQPPSEIRRRGFGLRRSLAELRRIAAPMNELVARLLRADLHFVEEALAPYFHDVHDHILRTTEDIDAARDRVGSILDTNLNEQGNELNEITKKLASWAAIIAVPTAVTGWYGQNVPYPGFGRHSGFISSTVVIILLAGGVYYLLRRRGWL